MDFFPSDVDCRGLEANSLAEEEGNREAAPEKRHTRQCIDITADDIARLSLSISLSLQLFRRSLSSLNT